MLRSAVAFRAIQTDSRSRSHPLLLLRYRGNGLEQTRYGISTSKRLGTAVVRNRQRRRLRTILRAVAADVHPGWDILLVMRPASAAASQADLAPALIGLLHTAGLVTTR
ncbi:MAG: ribonuclease P protein component [Chloroflexota bacterium]